MLSNYANGEKKMPFKNPADKARYMKKYNQKTVNQRVLRNRARQKAISEGKASVGDGTHVDHKIPLSKGGVNGGGNTRVVSAKTNREKYNKITICVTCNCDPCSCGEKSKKSKKKKET